MTNIDYFFWHLFRRRLIAAPVGDCWICQCWNKFMNQCTMKRNWFLFLNETTWMNTIWLSIAISQYILPQLLNLMGMFPLLVPFVLSWRSGHVRCLMHSLSYPNWHIAGVLIYALMGGWLSSILTNFCPRTAEIHEDFSSLTKFLELRNSIYLLRLRILV